MITRGPLRYCNNRYGLPFTRISRPISFVGVQLAVVAPSFGALAPLKLERFPLARFHPLDPPVPTVFSPALSSSCSPSTLFPFTARGPPPRGPPPRGPPPRGAPPR